MRPILYSGVDKNYYREDFAELVKELKTAQYDRLKVLGTFDRQVQVYWQTFRKGNSYVPDLFISTIEDSNAELRVINFAKTIGMNTDDFLDYTTTDINERNRQSSLWFGHAKYQAHQGYTYADIEEYKPEDQVKIKEESIMSTWHLIVPKS